MKEGKETKKKNNSRKLFSMDKLGTKIGVSTAVLTGACMLAVSFVAIILLSSSTDYILEETMTETAEIAAERVEKELESYMNIARELGCVARLSNAEYTVDDKMEIVLQRAADYNLVSGSIIGADGIDISSGADFNGTDTFDRAFHGEYWIAEPLIENGTAHVIVSAPLWQGGIPNTEVVGVVYLIAQENMINDIVTSIEVSRNGGAYILDKNGITIAHKNMENVLNRECTAEDAKTDKQLEDLAVIEGKMVQGEQGFGTYTYGGVKKFIAYAPIGGTNGWSLAVNAPTSDFMGFTKIAVIIVMVLLAVGVLLAIFVAVKLARGIAKPIEECSRRLEILAKGDLTTEVQVFDSKDETGKLSYATSIIVESLGIIIEDIKYLLGEMANGNFNIKTRAEDLYIGDFKAIILSLRDINTSLSSTLKDISNSSNNVALGSEQMAQSAVSLAEGATDQAAAVQQLQAAVDTTAGDVDKTLDISKETSSKMSEIGRMAEESQQKMDELTKAMNGISESSSEIGKIIATIEEIAEQTNLLSLNASIEAARAGETGRGFAVVAGEIGKLAAQCGEAVNNTRTLIEGSLVQIDRGNTITQETAEALLAVNKRVEEAVELVEASREAAQSQSDAIQQIDMGITQINTVVQSNSATAEETSATSEELSAQASALNEMVGKFTLKEV